MGKTQNFDCLYGVLSAENGIKLILKLADLRLVRNTIPDVYRIRQSIDIKNKSCETYIEMDRKLVMFAQVSLKFPKMWIGSTNELE